MSIDGLVTAVSAGIGAAAVVFGGMRRFMHQRDIRQQASFRKSVQDIVDTSVNGVILRQIDFERRQGRHLDRQDRAIADIRRAVERQNGQWHD